MKSTLKAGIALAALTGAVAMAGSTNAADLGGPRGGSIKDGYVEPMPQVTRGPAGPCYFRADVGYSKSNDPSARWAVTENTFDGADVDGDGFADGDANFDGIIDANEIVNSFLGDRVSNTSLDNSWFGEIGAGCGTAMGGRGFRGELMFGVHGSKKFDGEPLFYSPGPTPGDPTGTPPPAVYDDPMHTSIKSYTAMINLYKDLGTFGNLTPYVGAGIGASYNMASDFYFTDNPALTNRIRGDRDLSFAWSLMAGVGYQISDRATLDIGYRYLDLGSAGSENGDNAGNWNPRVSIDDLTSHEIKVGLRYNFGASDCCAQQYIPMK